MHTYIPNNLHAAPQKALAVTSDVYEDGAATAVVLSLPCAVPFRTVPRAVVTPNRRITVTGTS